MPFKCRKIDMAFTANVGSMPMALTTQMLGGQEAAGKTDAEREAALQKQFEQMSPVEQRSAIQASAQMIRYACVEPRLIIGEVNGHTNAISVDVLTMADFSHLAKWAGGGTTEGLKTFRRKRK